MMARPRIHAKNCVVVVEDEPLIRKIAVSVLINSGFIVMEADHGGQALRILESHASDIHILSTDIQVPGRLDGLGLAHHASLYWPWNALLITSGKARPIPTDMPAGSRLLPKPCDLDHMSKHVQELMVC